MSFHSSSYPRTNLLIFTLQVFVLGMSVGVLCHFAEHGWNAGTPTAAKYIEIIGTLVLFVYVVAQFFGLSNPRKYQ